MEGEVPSFGYGYNLDDYMRMLREIEVPIEVLEAVCDGQRKHARRLRETAANHEQIADAIGDLIEERRANAGT